MRCRAVDETPLELGADPATMSLVRRVAVAAGEREYALAWTQTIGGFLQIRVAIVPSMGGDPIFVEVTDGFFIHDQPTIARAGDGYVVAWMDTRDADFEIYARSVSSTGALGDLQRISNRMGRDEAPELVSSAGGAVIAWVEADDVASTRRAVTRPLDGTGAPTAALTPISTGTVRMSVPRLATLGSGLALGWVDSATAAPEVYLQALDASGVATGSPAPLTIEMNASGDLDLVLTTDGAAVWGAIPSAFPDVRARVVDAMGAPTGPPVVITLAPESGTDSSGTRLTEGAGWAESCRNGYAIAYRSRDGSATPTLRVRFVDEGLSRVHVIDLGSVTNDGGPTSIRMAGDGSILVGWADHEGTGVTMRASRIRCD